MTRLYISGNAVDQNQIPVVGAQVYVRAGGDLTTLEDVNGGPLANPLVTGADGFFEAYSVSTDSHVLDIYWGGRLRYVQEVSEIDRLEVIADISRAWAEGTEPGGEGTKSAREFALDAEGSVAAALAAAQTVAPRVSVLLTDSAITPNTSYVADAGILNGRNLTKAFLLVEGAGAAEVVFIINDNLASNPLLATNVPQSFDINLPVSVGSVLRVGLGAITGAPTAVIVIAEGLPA
jgi:hypothetical protein